MKIKISYGELILVLFDQVGQLVHEPSPLAGVHAPPLRVEGEGGLGGGHGIVDVGGVALLDLGDDLLGGRVDRGEGLARLGVAPLIVDEDLKERLCQMTAVHDIARVFAKRLNKDASALHDKFPPQEHPVIRTHPETGERGLYVNIAFTDYIVGMDKAESDELLNYLYRRAWLPEYQCRFRWAPGSLAFWDNRACQHYAASDYFPNVRIMERVTVAGDRPFFTA